MDSGTKKLSEKTKKSEVLTWPDPTRQNPAKSWPDPTRPDPTRPDPTRPDPTRPDPTRPDPRVHPTRGQLWPPWIRHCVRRWHRRWHQWWHGRWHRVMTSWFVIKNCKSSGTFGLYTIQVFDINVWSLVGCLSMNTFFEINSIRRYNNISRLLYPIFRSGNY